MKRKTALLLVASIVISCFFAGCSGGKLKKAELRYIKDSRSVAWTEIENAQSYNVNLSGQGVNRNVTILKHDEYQYEYVIDENISGQYTVSVIAKGDGDKHKDSDASILTFDYEKAPVTAEKLNGAEIDMTDAVALFVGKKNNKKMLCKLNADGSSTPVEFELPDGYAVPQSELAGEFVRYWVTRKYTFLLLSDEDFYINSTNILNNWFSENLIIENSSGKVYHRPRTQADDWVTSFYEGFERRQQNGYEYYSFDIINGELSYTKINFNPAVEIGSNKVYGDIYHNIYVENSTLTAKVGNIIYFTPTSTYYEAMATGSDGRMYYASYGKESGNFVKVYNASGELADVEDDCSVTLYPIGATKSKCLVLKDNGLFDIETESANGQRWFAVYKKSGGTYQRVNQSVFDKSTEELSYIGGVLVRVVTSGSVKTIYAITLDVDKIEAEGKLAYTEVLKCSAVKTGERSWIASTITLTGSEEYYLCDAGGEIAVMPMNFFDGEVLGIAPLYDLSDIPQTPGGETAGRVKSAFQAAGYNVTSESQSVLGVTVTVIIAYKGTDTITVIILPTEEIAVQAKPSYDTAAGAFGYTCKRDGKIIYYGTAAAIAVYENIS